MQFRDEIPNNQNKNQNQNDKERMDDLRALLNDNDMSAQEKVDALIESMGVPAEVAQSMMEAEQAMAQLLAKYHEAQDPRRSDKERARSLLEFYAMVKEAAYRLRPQSVGAIISAGVSAIYQLSGGRDGSGD